MWIICKKSGKFQKSVFKRRPLGCSAPLLQVRKRTYSAEISKPHDQPLGRRRPEMEQSETPNHAAHPRSLTLFTACPRGGSQASWATCPKPAPGFRLASVGLCPFPIPLISILNLVSPPLSPPCNVPWPLHVNSEIRSKFQFTDVNCPCDLSNWDKPGYFSWIPRRGIYMLEGTGYIIELFLLDGSIRCFCVEGK